MSFEVKDIKKMYEVFKKSSAEIIEFNKGTLNVRFVKSQEQPAPQPVSAASNAAPQAENQDSEIRFQELTAFNTNSVPANAICAKYVGKFMRKPGPNKSNFVESGDFVSKGQQLATIDVIGTKHEIYADRDGTIKDILVQDDHLVQFNQPIFIIE